MNEYIIESSLLYSVRANDESEARTIANSYITDRANLLSIDVRVKGRQ
jgi:hypothetical protein